MAAKRDQYALALFIVCAMSAGIGLAGDIQTKMPKPAKMPITPVRDGWPQPNAHATLASVFFR